MVDGPQRVDLHAEEFAELGLDFLLLAAGGEGGTKTRRLYFWGFAHGRWFAETLFDCPRETNT